MKQFYRYLGIGVVMTVFGYGAIFFCMYVLLWGPFLSNIVIYAVAIVCSYFLNRNFTFQSSGKRLPEALKFFGVFFLAYTANLGALKLLIDAGIHEGVSQVIAGGFYVMISYAANKFHVFRAQTDCP